jgi:membrane peptidoglycan carboxypeptidase
MPDKELPDFDNNEEFTNPRRRNNEEPTMPSEKYSRDEEPTYEQDPSVYNSTLENETDEEFDEYSVTEERPRPAQTETGDYDLSKLDKMPILDPENEEDVPFHLPKADSAGSGPTVDNRNNPNKMVTMPHFKEPGVPDPAQTLPGTGGLDPNPDMLPLPFADGTYSAKTVMNLPKAPAEQNPARRPEPSIPSVQGNMTAANPNVADDRYQRPGQQPQMQNVQGAYVPPPPQRQGAQQRNQRTLPKRRNRRIMGLRPGCMYMLIGLLMTFCGGFTLTTILVAAIFVPRIEEQWTAQVVGIDNYRAFESTFYYDRYGNTLYEAFNEGRRDTITYDRLPQYLINATVAIEDDSFWSNFGVDFAATFVAAMNYFGSGQERVPGGSTITQQLVRNVLFDFERRNEVSVNRKIEEIMLAVALTASQSKEDIITMYLNEIYYGNLAYGAQAAAQTFFGKNAADLTLGEAALLAGLPQAPRDLDPLNPDPVVQDRVYQRWRTVLNEMVEEGYITAEQRDTALRDGLNFVTPDDNDLRAPHFTIYAQNEFVDIMEQLGHSPETVAVGGYRVYTTIDQEVNDVALGAARTQVSNLAGNNVSNAAVVVLQPISGQILAMVGSIDYNSEIIDGRFNAAIGLRQPGSTMKPFTYAAALERGMTAGDVIWDTPTEIGIPGQPMYIPRNYDGAFHGPMGMRRALANSFNIPAVQTLRLIGVDYLLGMMERVGISTLGLDASQYGLSLTLGGGEVSLVEYAAAYGVFANQGAYVPQTSILCIVDSDNNIVYQYENGCPQGAGTFTSSTTDRRGFGTQVMDPRIAFIITDILSDNESRSEAMGARSALYTEGIGTSVKTGTTNDVKDNWTMGYTRNVVVGVWVGNNNGDPLVNSSGLTGAAPIWNSVMTTIYTTPGMLDAFRVDGQLLPDIPNPPQGLVQQQICIHNRITDPATSCPAQANEWFLDSPAAIPDGNGNMVYPEPIAASQPQSTGTMQEISPDVYRAIVFPLNPGLAASLQFNLSPGDLPPPAPRYCRVTPELIPQAQASGGQELVFVAGPSTSQSDAVRAEEYARARGIAFLPTIDCWADAFSAGAGGFGAPVVTAVITSPANGQAVGNPVSIVGTVQFDSSQAEFWHLDIIGGQFGDWTPMGGAGYSSVINGELFRGDLPPGNYRVRLRLVQNGNYLQQPYETSFTVQ